MFDTRDLPMMKTPDRWPHGNVLPLTRPPRSKDDSPIGQAGLLIDHPDLCRTEVFILNLFDARLNPLRYDGITDGLESIRYDDFEGIQDDDWTVD